MGTNSINSSGTITATTFVGNFNGNAATVTNGVYLSGVQEITGNKTFSGNNTTEILVNANLTKKLVMDLPMVVSSAANENIKIFNE